MSTPRRSSSPPLRSSDEQRRGDPKDLTSDDIGSPATAEDRSAPTGSAEAAGQADRYERMTRLADRFDDAAKEIRRRASLGADIVSDPAFADSAELAKATFDQAHDDIRAATTGKHGLLSRSLELDADALVLRATVLTYRWIDELQDAAYKALGSIAGRAIGYLAPQVALGGAIVSAGLIETDALDRDGVAAYLNELADHNAELMEHVTSGGGGLLDGLRMRALLTTGVLADDRGRSAGRGGLRAIGVAPLAAAYDTALRDVAGGLLEEDEAAGHVAAEDRRAPAGVADLMETLANTTSGVAVQRVSAGRYIAYLPGPNGSGARGRLRLVGGDHTAYADTVVRAIERAVDGDPGARVMLVGSAQGGVTAAEVAATLDNSCAFVVDQVVTAGAPSAHVPRIPETTRVLSLEDRADPVALLGSLVNAGSRNRVTVVFDGERGRGAATYVAGGRAADDASHPELRAEISRIQELGYLAG